MGGQHFEGQLCGGLELTIQYHMQIGNHRGKSYTSTLKHFFSTVHVAWKEFRFSGVQLPNFSDKNSNFTEIKRSKEKLIFITWAAVQ